MADPFAHLRHIAPDLHSRVDQIFRDSSIKTITVTFKCRTTNEPLLSVEGECTSYEDKKAFVLAAITDFCLDGSLRMDPLEVVRRFKPVVTGR